jgi:hypothetical protein
MSVYAPRCRTHHQPAGWKCTACHSPLCPNCAAIQKTQHVEMIVCTLCREIATPLTRHRRDEASYIQRLPVAFAWPFTSDALISMLAVGAFYGVMSWFGAPGRMLGAIGLYAATYAIIRMTAANQPEYFVDAAGAFDLIWPMVKSALVYVLLIVIAVVYIFWFKRPGSPWLTNPVLWSLAIIGFVFGPMTTLMAACHAPFLQMLNPVLIAGYIAKLGADYWVALVSLAIVGGLGGIVGMVVRLINILPISFIPTLLGAVVEVYFSFVSARILGLLLLVHGDRVGYGVQSDYETPLLGSAQPLGVLAQKAEREIDTSIPEPVVNPETAPVEAPPRSYAPLEFDEGSSGPMELVKPGEGDGGELGTPRQARGERGGAAPESGPLPVRELDANALPSSSDFFAAQVKESAARGDWATALDAWKACPDKVSLSLGVEHLTGLGRTAASQGENDVAREVLELASNGDAADVLRARAKVILARLLRERFNDAAKAQALFQEVVTKAPGTDAAQFAQKMLRP